jgi:CheY-like chemotaxis protein
LFNIVLNARDAMPDGGAIIIDAEPVDIDPGHDNLPPALTPGRYARLRVSDTGRGMSSDVATHACEPFFTTKPKDKGVGLGLATAYGSASQAGGTITIHSQLDVGTTVTVYLPLVEHTTTAAAPAAADPAPPGHGEHLLIAEDENALRELIVRILERHGYTVQAADRGSHALDLARDHPPQLLLTDLIMPEMSGRELAERLRRRHPHLPVIFVTGYSDGLLNPDNLTNSHTQLIRKPFTPDQLLHAVHMGLRNVPTSPRR